MPLLFPLYAWRGLAYILQQHSSLISQQTVLVLCPFQAACASVGKLSTLLLLLLLHAAYQKCNTNCFNVRASRCSPNCNNNEFALMMRQALSHSLSLSHHSLSHFNLENILNSASSIKQMKKTQKHCKLFCGIFYENWKYHKVASPMPSNSPYFNLSRLAGESEFTIESGVRPGLGHPPPSPAPAQFVAAVPRNVNRHFDSSSNRWLPFNRCGYCLKSILSHVRIALKTNGKCQVDRVTIPLPSQSEQV